jgi:hypothetical protein
MERKKATTNHRGGTMSAINDRGQCRDQQVTMEIELLHKKKLKNTSFFKHNSPCIFRLSVLEQININLLLIPK